MKKLSIIMAVRNKKDFIERAVSSFNGINKNTVELIIIDDNSDDGTSELLANSKYSWINYERLTEKRSTGYCRNLGLSKATGEYIGFLDGDDYMCVENILKIVEKAKEEKADVACGYHTLYNFKNNKVKSELLGVKLDTKGRYIEELPSDTLNLLKYVNATCWNKVFRKEFIEDNNVKFTDCSYCEDRAFTQASLMLSKKSIVVNETVYMYTEPYTNTTATNTQNNVANGLWLDYFEYIKYLAKIAERVECKNRARDLIGVVIIEAVDISRFVRGLINEEAKEQFDKMYIQTLEDLALKYRNKA